MERTRCRCRRAAVIDAPAVRPADFEIDYIRVWQRRDLASDADGPKPNEGGLDGRVGPGLPGPGRADPRDDAVREAHRRVAAAAESSPEP